MKKPYQKPAFVACYEAVGGDEALTVSCFTLLLRYRPDLRRSRKHGTDSQYSAWLWSNAKRKGWF